MAARQPSSPLPATSRCARLSPRSPATGKRPARSSWSYRRQACARRTQVARALYLRRKAPWDKMSWRRHRRAVAHPLPDNCRPLVLLHSTKRAVVSSRHLLWLGSLLPPRTKDGVDTSGHPRRTPYYGWVLMVVLGITTIICYGTTQYLFGVLVVPLDATFHWGRASISGAYALGLIVAGLLGVPIGALVDRWGARLLMSCGSALAALSLFGLARMNTQWQFYLLWSGGLGLAMALTLYPVTFTVVANWFVRKRGSALAILTLGGGLSSPICIPLAGPLVVNGGWRSTLVLLGLG